MTGVESMDQLGYPAVISEDYRPDYPGLWRSCTLPPPHPRVNRWNWTALKVDCCRRNGRSRGLPTLLIRWPEVSLNEGSNPSLILLKDYCLIVSRGVHPVSWLIFGSTNCVRCRWEKLFWSLIHTQFLDPLSGRYRRRHVVGAKGPIFTDSVKMCLYTRSGGSAKVNPSWLTPEIAADIGECKLLYCASLADLSPDAQILLTQQRRHVK